ncbi:hypothetical protein [Haloarchaeobius sp. TZWSO28]|uniref:hypothetical protein n=1 Tax=Haloarchaeobius sp. TZWSO28 TaxID=3446119 RepID=UPI003EB90C64
MATEDETTQVGVKVKDPTKQTLNRIAFEQSEPGDTKTASDIVRDAIHNYISQYETNPEVCTGRGIGECLEGIELTNEGAV